MEKVEAYVRKNYKRMYEDKPLIISESDSCFYISSHKDESPLILSKKILNG